jgi:hypothetical protein
LATEATIRQAGQGLVIPADLSELLQLHETDTHYAVRTYSGATLLRPKADILYPWQLLEGVLDDGRDTTEERSRERKLELAREQRKFGA